MHGFVIIGTLIYVLSEDKTSVLMVHRHKRSSDDQLGFYNGLGGKMEDKETLVECMQRELFEEANIRATKFSLRGFVHWEGFGKRAETWMGAVFLVEEFAGALLNENQEGTLEFIPLNKLDNLPLFEGDKAFLSKVFDKEESLFHAFLSYENKKFLHGRCTRQEDVEEFNTHAAGDVSFS